MKPVGGRVYRPGLLTRVVAAFRTGALRDDDHAARLAALLIGAGIGGGLGVAIVEIITRLNAAALSCASVCEVMF